VGDVLFIMDISATTFHDVKLIESPVHWDHRGFFCETFKVLNFKELLIQDNMAYSLQKGTIRGLHYQMDDLAQAKLIGVLSGSIYDVVVDLRKDSSTYGLYGWTRLHAIGRHPTGRWLYVPRGFAHGYQTLEDGTLVTYKVDNIYSPAHEAGIRWDDPDLAVDWPIKEAILSDKDRNLPFLKGDLHGGCVDLDT